MGVRSNSKSRPPVALRRALLSWYDRNRRDLPWRKNRDPYRVWVSEVMLQQTRIAVVEPAYRRFIRTFPTMRRLAAASQEEVLAEWSGLGYYRRARSLHRAAQVLADSRRAFPRDYREALALPGVGDYTAAAVLSIAYGEAHAAVDGNVIRVLSRLFRLGLPGAGGEPHQTVADDLLDRSRPGDWNQAVMELGETTCGPIEPLCASCPLRRWCAAHRAGVAHLHPPAKQRRKTEKVRATMLVLRDGRGRVLLERGVFRYLPDMWLPLMVESSAIEPGEDAAEISHAITHRSFRIRVVGRRGDLDAEAAETRRGERRAFTPAGLSSIGRSSLLDKALAAV